MSHVHFSADGREIVCDVCGARTPTGSEGGDARLLLRAQLAWIDAHEACKPAIEGLKRDGPFTTVVTTEGERHLTEDERNTLERGS